MSAVLNTATTPRAVRLHDDLNAAVFETIGEA